MGQSKNSSLNISSDGMSEILQKAKDEKGSNLTKKEKTRVINKARNKILKINKAFEVKELARITTQNIKIRKRLKEGADSDFQWSASINIPFR